MPSRIDIGPEGGPFVAINENSNDLELQDINGNVIAVWDETAGQWDFKTNDLANVGGVDATGLTSSLDVGGNDLTNINTIDANEVSADSAEIKQEGPIIKTWAQDGADPDARLDNALAAATPGDVIHLENADYAADRTISTAVKISGPVDNLTSGEIKASFSLDTEGIVVENVHIDGAASAWEINGDRCVLRQWAGAPNINLNGVAQARLINGVYFNTITLDSNTSDCVVNSIAGSPTVTDDGSNIVGDIV